MMDLSELITEERISLDLLATDKIAVIKEMIDVLGNHERVVNKAELLLCLQEREKLESTGIGDGIALPHARTDLVKEIMVAFGRSKQGVEFESLDGKPVHLFFLIVSPKENSSKLMQVLAKLCRLLRDDGFRQALLYAESKQKALELIQEKNLY